MKMVAKLTVILKSVLKWNKARLFLQAFFQALRHDSN